MAQTKIRGSQLQLSYAFKAYFTSDSNNYPEGSSVIVWDTEEFDEGGNYNTSTGGFTAPVTGYYQFNVQCLYAGASSGDVYQLQIFKDGALHSESRVYSGSTWTAFNVSDILYVPAGDIVNTKFVVPSGAGAVTDIKATRYRSYFSGALIRGV